MHRCNVLWAEMTHFIYQLQYYILFEVLEVSWKDLMDFLNRSTDKDLDQLIRAHNQYLNDVTTKSLLSSEQGLSRKLSGILDVILEFQSVYERLYTRRGQMDEQVKDISESFHVSYLRA